ncbi:unnamed protein product [Adineta ricciae]|uniref:Uncharacterized protein n=1 Tax=Adineta ricciae TaxID=249248 RepID=A0A813WNH7_ADIRI|nr:unnamed protein product [Adineta ricciae]
MPEKPKSRPLSASRQRRQHNRRSSLNSNISSSETIQDPVEFLPESIIFYGGLDLRPTKEKIESLEKELELRKDDSTLEEHLQSLVLMQLYISLEYGEASLENARAYLNLGRFYFDQRNLLPQAKVHILNARQILEQMNIQLTNDHLVSNLLAYEIYFLLIKYSLQAKQYLSLQRDSKTKNKHILAIDTTHIDHDLNRLEEYLEKLQPLMSSSDYDEKYRAYLFIKFDAVTTNTKEFQSSIIELVKAMIEILEKYPSEDQIKQKIDIYLRSGFYFINFNHDVNEGLNYYKRAVELAEEEEQRAPSDVHKYQLGNALFQWGKARVRTERLTDNTERKFRRAIDVYRQVNGENDKNVLRVIDELATYYTKMEKFQEALNILCESLPDKRKLYGDFAEELIQTESRIGAIYLRECEYLNAAEHLKECLDLQEFVYGPKDSRTCQTRDAIEILKKDPTVSRTFFSRTQDGIRQDRPAFRYSNRVSHEKQDHDLLFTVTKKPPSGSKNSSFIDK